MKDTKKTAKDFLQAFAYARRGTVSWEGQTARVNLPQSTARQLGVENPCKIVLGGTDALQGWQDQSKILRLLEEEVVGLPKLFRCRYRVSETSEAALTFFKKAVRGLKATLSHPEQLECEALRCAVKVVFQGESLTESLYVGIAIPLLQTCRIENEQPEIQADLLAPFHKSELAPASIIWALQGIFSSLEEEIIPQYEAIQENLRKVFHEEKRWVEAFYEDLITDNSETQGLEPPTGGPRERLEQEQSQIIANLRDRYKLSVRFEPVTLCLLHTSCYVFRAGGWMVAKLPFSDRLFSTGCTLCKRTRDSYSLQGNNLYCAVCRRGAKS